MLISSLPFCSELHNSILIHPVGNVQETLGRLTGTPKDAEIWVIAYIIKEPTIVVKTLYESEVLNQ